MFEYVISYGEGTLIDYGVVSGLWQLESDQDVWEYYPAEPRPQMTIMVQSCADDCETGK